MENKARRIPFLDIAKGIAIIAVVVGHSDSLSPDNAIINSFIYTFHMPVFFVISGYLFSKKDSFKSFFNSKAKSTIPPYILSFVLALICNGLIKCSYYDFSGSRVGTLKTVVISYLYGVGLPLFSGKVQTTGPLWFLPCLLLVNLIFYFAITVTEKIAKNNIAWLFAIVSLLTFSGTVLQTKYIVLPFSMDIALSCQIYMFAGYLFKRYSFLENKKNDLPILIISLAGYLYVALTYQGVSLNNRTYANYFTSLIGALCGSLLVMVISKYIDKLIVVPGILEFIGNITIIILCFHISDCTFMSLNNIKFLAPMYQSTVLLTLFRLGFSVLIYVVISVTPLYKLFFKSKPRKILINAFSERINRYKKVKEG